MVIDCITFNGENELFELRYNILKEVVDVFVVVEFDTTFSGKKKPSYFIKNKYHTWDKVKYFNFSKYHYEHYRELAEQSPNTIGASHWKTEFMQKESIKDALAGVTPKDTDIIFIGDCDEIWDATFLDHQQIHSHIHKLKLRVYSYYLNNRSTEEFYGTIVAPYEKIRDTVLNHVRSTDHIKINQYFGWHFTSIGGFEEVKRKLSDSYTEESYWNEEVQRNLSERFSSNTDFLGRGFTYSIDYSEWPQYLKDHIGLYSNLCLSQKI